MLKKYEKTHQRVIESGMTAKLSHFEKISVKGDFNPLIALPFLLDFRGFSRKIMLVDKLSF